MPDLDDIRSGLSPLGLADIGRSTGGALLVYLAAGDHLSDGRKMFDAAQDDDDVLITDMEGVWDLGRHLDEWSAAPTAGPQVLLALHGPVKRRSIAGAVLIDTHRWLDPSLEVPATRRWNVPLRSPIDLDANSLRYRRVNDIKFGRFNWQLHIWVDRDGVRRHPLSA